MCFTTSRMTGSRRAVSEGLIVKVGSIDEFDVLGHNASAVCRRAIEKEDDADAVRRRCPAGLVETRGQGHRQPNSLLYAGDAGAGWPERANMHDEEAVPHRSGAASMRLNILLKLPTMLVNSTK
jgi:hypothetical protein